jgi:hypothetical protein
MSAPFEGLREQLLRGGIAPRHVRRYLRELDEHMADLVAAQQAAGYQGEDARSRARARLGADAELAQAMIEQRDFRALSARFPWLVFGLLPPLAVIVCSVILVMTLAGIGVASGAIVPDQKIHPPVPGWYAWTASIIIFAVNCLVTPALGFLLAWMAQRQRMKPVWPFLAMVLILFLGLYANFEADAKNISIDLGTVLPIRGPFGMGGFIRWPSFLAQALLLILPASWLLWTRRKAGAGA